ncbi:hypothetical protein SUGI_0893310 [Cryptomeria japonica]|uniref:protein ROOT PRIMORDIUM DEFECTIVE 1 n=1 Tax=Cryptomeria japonica TaxID=3369 RepID=UPI002414B521|nr:protein ROOT PRIMORDIUM DEFECTIVE 1 [Cryptomeria japonica]GLJ43037.1 hypothetical protein SUGI_0893310 [Cryptomeria japonica]
MNIIMRTWTAIAMAEKSKRKEWQWQAWRLKSSNKSNIKFRTKDHAFDDYMEVCKKVRKVVKFQSIILAQPEQSICVARLDTLGRRLGLKMYESGRFVLKYPHIFEVFEHPVQRLLWCRLTPKAMEQIQEERAALIALERESVIRLQKLIMMAAGGRVCLEHIYHARKDLGLPDDLEVSIILKYPQYFQLTCPNPRDKNGLMKYVELANRDPSLAVCAIEKVREKEYRDRGSRREEDTRFSFLINLPPCFRISRAYRVFLMKWQRMPYWSPYEDISRQDLRTLEAQKRLQKRVIATLHEFLTLTVEKNITLEKIAHFRECFYLPNKLKDFLLQHQGIFYISTRGNYGKLHTIFLREAYSKGELITPNPVYLARRKLVQLILLSPRKATLDPSLTFYKNNDRDDEKMMREYFESSYKLDEDLLSKKTEDSDHNDFRRSQQMSLGLSGCNAMESNDRLMNNMDMQSHDNFRKEVDMVTRSP